MLLHPVSLYFRLALVAAGTGLALLSGPVAYAQNYPAKPVKMVVPFPPGGSLDIAGRLIEQKLADGWGQSVVVENKTAGTPPAIVAKWNADVAKVLHAPDVRAKLMADGAEPAPNAPEQFAQMIARELTKYARIVKASGAKVD